jgi:5-formyltetrahydrofolate cyclo-ligase
MPDAVKLRKKLREKRLALSPREQRLHAISAARHFAGSSLLLRFNRIALYIANNGELDPAPIAARIRECGKNTYLPVLQLPPRQALWFCEYPKGEALRRNRFGIPEPDMMKHRLLPAWGLDLILMPLVAFDSNGNRLGMGGGFYDRTLSYLHRRNYWQRPSLIGLAHECQQVVEIKPNPWDIPLDGIITESGVLKFPGCGR